MKKKKAKKPKKIKIETERLYSMVLMYFTIGILIGILISMGINQCPEPSEYDNLKAVIENIGDWQCTGKEPTHCPTFNLKMKLTERGFNTLNECMIIDGERIFWLSITLDEEEYYIDTMTGILFRPEYSYYKPIDWNECVNKGSLIG